MAATNAVVNGLESLSVEDSSPHNTVESKSDDEHTKRWGFTLEEIYKIALKFYKGINLIVKSTSDSLGFQVRYQKCLFYVIY